MGARRAAGLRLAVAVAAGLMLAPAVGVAAWAATARGELGYDLTTTSVCRFRQTETSSDRNCIGLNAAVLAPVGLAAGVAGLLHAHDPRRRWARRATLGLAGATLAVLVWVDAVTGRRDWAYAVLTVALAGASFLLADPNRAAGKSS